MTFPVVEAQVVSLSEGSTIIAEREAALQGIYINTTLGSAGVDICSRNGQTVVTVPAFSKHGSFVNFGGYRMVGITVEPGVGATGNITISWGKLPT